mgnify:CR=1 FL=1
MAVQGVSASRLLLITVFLVVAAYCAFLQFLSPCLYEVDGYYNAAVANFIKDLGPRFKFHWAQVSTFRDSYGDTEFIFHLSIIPFLYLVPDIVFAGKLCVVFWNIVFLLTFLYILKKYLPGPLAAIFMALPFLSPAFTLFFLRLRAVTPAIILTALSVHCLIKKRFRYLFALSAIYALSHPSFPLMILLAFMCEAARRFKGEGFFAKNVYAVLLGGLVGLIINPTFPNNVFTMFLNGVMVPIYSVMDKGIIFGREVYTQAPDLVLTANFAVFFALVIILWMAFVRRPRISFATVAWSVPAVLYLLLALRSDRFWYPANALFFIFFASFLADCKGGGSWKDMARPLAKAGIIYGVIIAFFLPLNTRIMKDTIAFDIAYNSHFERVGRWMRANLPKGERVYHANGDNASYFLCMNPDNDYLVLCDPIYMFWKYPKEYAAFLALRQGKVEKPYEVIRDVFACRYGYTQKDRPLYRQVAGDPAHFNILYEDGFGVVFEVGRFGRT